MKWVLRGPLGLRSYTLIWVLKWEIASCLATLALASSLTFMVALKTKAHEVSDGLQIYKN